MKYSEVHLKMHNLGLNG